MDGVLSSARSHTTDRGAQRPPMSTKTETAARANREFDLSTSDFRRVTRKIYEEAGIVLGEQKRDMIVRRLSKRIRARGLDSFRRYMDLVESGDPAELVEFRNALTTNLTSFFREAHHFDRLKAYFAEHGDQRTYRIWSAACSTGEEPYSVAISAVEHFQTERPPVQILCTDLDTEVVAKARQGVYTLERVTALEKARKRRFFQRGVGPNEGMVRVNPVLQGFMDFGTQNLLDDSYLVKPGLDVIFLRNVMIYFDRDTQRHILERMAKLLRSDGMLIVGHSENLFHVADLFSPVGQTVYRLAARS